VLLNQPAYIHLKGTVVGLLSHVSQCVLPFMTLTAVLCTYTYMLKRTVNLRKTMDCLSPFLLRLEVVYLPYVLVFRLCNVYIQTFIYI